MTRGCRRAVAASVSYRSPRVTKEDTAENQRERRFAARLTDAWHQRLSATLAEAALWNAEGFGRGRS